MILIRKNYFSIFSFFLLCLIIASCKKDTVEQSSTPEITFISATPSNLIEYQDSLILKFAYKDGDGDLGENNPDVKNLFVTDNRIGITYPFRIQQLSPSGTIVSIQGELYVVLHNVAITDGSNSQSATFTLYVTDRAGHKSNSVNSPAITIVK